MKVHGFNESQVVDKTIIIGQSGPGCIRRYVKCPPEFTYLRPYHTENDNYKLVSSNNDTGWIIRLTINLQNVTHANRCVSIYKEHSDSITTLARGLGYSESRVKGLKLPWFDYLFSTKMDNFWIRVADNVKTQILSFDENGVSIHTYQEARELGFDLDESTGHSNGSLAHLG